MASVGEDVGERYFKLSVQIYKEYWNVFFFFLGGGGIVHMNLGICQRGGRVPLQTFCKSV